MNCQATRLTVVLRLGAVLNITSIGKTSVGTVLIVKK